MSVAAAYPTRLETRTKESNMCASYWVEKPKGEIKVKTAFGVSRYDPRRLVEAEYRPV